MDENNRIKILLNKYLTQTITKEEYDELAELFVQYRTDELDDIFDQLELDEQQWYLQDLEFDQENVLEKIQTKLSDKRHGLISPLWRKVALAVASCFILAFGYIIFDRQIDSNSIATSKYGDRDILILDSNQVKLELANGHVFEVYSDLSENRYSENGWSIGSTADGGVIYKVDPSFVSTIDAAGKTNTFSTNKGSQSYIILEDGTKVWLNSGSSLTFPITFSGKKERNVEVIGEAFFEVAHNEKQPFIVKSSNAAVQVLGTEFNVRAYPDQAHIQTTLAQGSVKISSQSLQYRIKPGQQASVEKNGEILIATVHVDDVIAWKSGIFQFTDLSIPEIVNELSRWYDIRGIDDLSTKNDRFTGTLNKGKSLSNILEQLETISNNHFKLQEGRVIIVD